MSIVKHISLGLALLMVLMTGSAAAEKVWTKGEASLRAEADRKSSRVALIQANRELSVIERKGAWYRVKSGAKSGWIHRSSLRGERTPERDRAGRPSARDRADDPSALDRAGSADAEPSPESAAFAAGSGDDSGDPAANQTKTPKRVCREGSVWCDREGDAMRVVVVVSRVKAYKEPGEDEEIAFLATQDQELLVVGYHKPNWMYVQTLDGKLGWLKKDTVREKGNLANVRGGFFDDPSASETDNATDATRVAGRSEDVEDEGSLLPEEPSRWRVRLGMGLGGALFGRTFTGDNQDGANYDASSTGVVTTLSGDIRYQLSDAWHGGIDGNFSLIAAVGGLTYDLAGDQTLAVGNYVQHRTEASAKLGYDVDSWAAYLRIGGLVEIFYINDLLNAAALPRERLISPTVGLQLALRPTPELELGLRGDVMLLGALAQTRGREDGDFDGLFAVIAQADALYALMERVALQASFRVDRVSPSWSGDSVRAAGVQGASRTDQILRVLLGVQARF